MSEIINTIGMENMILTLIISNLILFIMLIISIIKIFGLNKKYKKFIKKLGSGKNIEEDLENYMYRVERVEKQNNEINNSIKSIDKSMENCIQKIGIVRYSAFKDTGSDLSFALALLDENNNGVVLNGIYSREMSNIYAKPVEKGESKYTTSEEEKQAIKKAIESKGIYKI